MKSIATYFSAHRAYLRPILAIGLPVVIQNLISQAQFLINRAFLGHQDSQFLAAIGNVMTPYNALTFFIMSAITGTTILVSHAYKSEPAPGEERYLNRIVTSSFTLFGLSSVGILIMWELAAPIVLAGLGAAGDIAMYSTEFMRIISLYIIVMGPEMVISATLQGCGNTRPMMIAAIIKSVLTVMLDILLINGFGPIPMLGLRGAAIAMLVANIAGGTYLLVWFSLKSEARIRPTKQELLTPQLHLIKRILGLGLPTGFESFLWFSGQLVLVRVINGIDGLSLGSFSLVMGLQGIVGMIPMGMAKSAQALAGQAFGGGKHDEARRVGIFCLVLALLMSVPMSLTFLLLPEQILSMFSNDSAINARSLPLLMLAPLFVSFQIFNLLMGHSIRALGDTRWMLATQIFGTAFVLVLSFVITYLLNAGMVAIYCIMICDEAIRGMANLRHFLKFGKRLKTPKVCVETV